MAASGKSSNRRTEYARGYSSGGGHGIYASQGRADRAAADRHRAAATTRADQCNKHATAQTEMSKPARTAALTAVALTGAAALAIRALRR